MSQWQNVTSKTHTAALFEHMSILTTFSFVVHHVLRWSYSYVCIDTSQTPLYTFPIHKRIIHICTVSVNKYSPNSLLINVYIQLDKHELVETYIS